MALAISADCSADSQFHVRRRQSATLVHPRSYKCILLDDPFSVFHLVFVELKDSAAKRIADRNSQAKTILELGFH